jgi:hypothetical protein
LPPKIKSLFFYDQIPFKRILEEDLASFFSFLAAASCILSSNDLFISSGAELCLDADDVG